MSAEIRIQKILSQCGIASRRKGEKLLADGHVTVNGKIITQLGAKADPAKDHIKVDGKPIKKKEKLIYLLLNKPRGYITTLNDDKNRPKVCDLINNVKERVFPVGRLDFNTEGLLIMTNDGMFAQGLSHPLNQIRKVYLARVKGIPDEKKMKRLAKGIKIKGEHLAPLKVGMERVTGNNCWLRFVLIQGKNRQVRLLCESIGHTVSKLKRVKYGSLNLTGLRLGEYRRLNYEEVTGLQKMIKK
jgi:23S rRNA pseudouridine2605 synthase